MTLLHGFELLRETFIPEYNTTAKLYRHQRTGAELLSLENSDENKAFSVNFKTPAPDSTGMTHIMEHSVLCGSRKYPLKEPFVELLKSSLNTFVNAMTFSDMTIYPVASQNTQDLYNMIDVYMDAVFYPNLTEKTLQQEGWHYELDNPNDPLIYKGVVFNEMKGAYSAPERLLDQAASSALFPDTPYVYDSGGDPKVIPQLTYEAFKTYHDTYYHPSNARFFFYGDDEPNERLRVVDAFIAEFERKEINPVLPLQPRFSEPRAVTAHYPMTEDETSGNKTMLTTTWLLNECTDRDTSLALSVLDHILMDTPASPLRRALIESGLGEDVTGGLDPWQRELTFSAGLKGIASADAPKVEALILETLQHLAENGIERGMIEAAINTTEFAYRENNTGSFPRGLSMLMRVLTPWMHGDDPLARIPFEEKMSQLKEKIAAGDFFENLIGEYLLNNPHRVTVTLEPDPTLAEQWETEEKARLAMARAGLNEDDLQNIIADTRILKQMQETPDSPEALATVPHLRLEDMEKHYKPLPTEVIEEEGATLLYHDLFTNGIVYFEVGFDLHTLPQEYLPYVDLFGRALLEMGTDTEDYVLLTQRIGRKTGGLYHTSLISTPLGGSTEAQAWFFLRGKAMAHQAEALLEIMEDVLQHANFDNPERFRQIVLEEKMGFESALTPAGHRIAMGRLSAHFSEAAWANEMIGGVENLFFLRKLVEQIETDWRGVLVALETIRQTLVNRRNMLINITVDEENWHHIHPQLNLFLSHLPDEDVTHQTWERTPFPAYEGLIIPAQVNYVAKGGNLYEAGYQPHGSHLAITSYLRTTWLWEKVRVQGGAYGGFCAFNEITGMFSFGSYRDPNLLLTLSNFDGTAQFAQNHTMDRDEVVRSIIGAIGSLDAYRLPDAKGYQAMANWILNVSDEIQQQRRDELLATTLDDYRAFGKALEALNPTGQVVVLGSEVSLQNANTAQGGNWLSMTKVL